MKKKNKSMGIKTKKRSLYPERKNAFGEYFWDDKIKVKQTELLIGILKELKGIKDVLNRADE